MNTSCNTKKYLKPGEAYLVENKINLQTKEKIKNKRTLLYELETVYKQKPNKNFLNIPGISRRWFWYRYQERDTSKSKKLLKRLAEPPAIFDDELAYKTAETMKFYLQNRGYFNADVIHTKERLNDEGNKVEVNYLVTPGKLYKVDTLKIISKDKKVERIINAIKKNSYLKLNAPVDQRLYQKEVSRITSHLRDNGYAYFYPKYVAPVTGDSLNHRVKIDLEVLTPEDSVHQTYNFGEIYVYPQFEAADLRTEFEDTLINGIHFMLPKGADFKVRPKIILRNIFLENGGLYSFSKLERTSNALQKLGVYKIVNINEEPHINKLNVQNIRIYLTPRKVFETGIDGEINTSTTTLVGNNRFFGAGVGLSLKDRNAFKGAELLVMNSSLNFDFNVSKLKQPDSLVNTLDFQLSSDLYLPKFVDYLGLWGGLKKLNITSDNFYTQLKEKSSTRLSVGYNFVNRFRYYKLNSFSAAYGYEIPSNNNQKYSVDHFGVSFLIPTVLEGLQEIFNNNPFLERSFDRQLFTGLLLRNIGYSFTLPTKVPRERYSLSLDAEFSGFEIWGANKLYNAITNKDIVFEVKSKNGKSTSFEQFVVLQSDFRFFKQLNRARQLAFHLYGGLGMPFGYSQDVPFVKQFYVGGPNSIRAWRAREIGPGGYLDPLTRQENANPLQFYQTGSVKLEASAEYRFKMFDIFGFDWNGALFLDVGNVWTLKEDPDRELSKFSWSPQIITLPDGTTKKLQENFIKQLAVGTGFGLRMDFKYFIFRFDIGIPLRNPYPLERDGKIHYWRNWRDVVFDKYNYNLGLGYPF